MIRKQWSSLLVSLLLIAGIYGVIGVTGGSKPLTARASGTFTVQGTQIIDPNGKPFLIKGVNINGPNWVWPVEMTQYADLIGSGAWHFNLVRVNSELKGNNFHDNDNTDTIVNAFTSRGIVVMFEAHDWTGTYPSGSDLSLVENWHQNLASKYKNNPYVWFDTFNEPGDCSSPVDPQWLVAQQGIISAIRDGAGASNPIIVEDNGWAQGSACSSSDAILGEGNQVLHFNNKNYGNIIFNTHIYCGWNNNQSGMNSYFDQISAKNYALFVGEFGILGGSNCDATSSVQEMYNAMATRSIGRVVWHWYGGDGNNLTNTDNPSGGWKINSTTNPTNLTWLGQQVWNDTHSSSSGGGGSGTFSSGFESGDPQPSWTNTVDSGGYPAGGLNNVTGICCGLTGPEAGTRNEIAHNGSQALMYSGKATNGSGADYAYTKVFDLSSHNVTIGSSTTLSYWIYPESSSNSIGGSYVSGNNSSCVAIDLIFSDGSNLRDSGATDQNGNRVHPAYQCNHLTLDSWNHVTTNLGSVANGKTVVRIDVGYDHPNSTGGYRGYVDDIAIG